MIRYLLALGCLLAGLQAGAQFGVSTFYNVNSPRVDTEVAEDGGSALFPYENGAELAVNYWFRLPTKRVEFQPTLYYAREMNGGTQSEFGLQFKTNIYPFDFGTDCNCPTFGKQGPQIQKGFFLQLSPGVAYHRAGAGGSDERSPATALSVGGGVGIDFGVSNLLTVTPLFSGRYSLGGYRDADFTDSSGQPADEYSVELLTLQFGLQLTFRLDKRRY